MNGIARSLALETISTFVDLTSIGCAIAALELGAAGVGQLISPAMIHSLLGQPLADVNAGIMLGLSGMLTIGSLVAYCLMAAISADTQPRSN